MTEDEVTGLINRLKAEREEPERLCDNAQRDGELAALSLSYVGWIQAKAKIQEGQRSGNHDFEGLYNLCLDFKSPAADYQIKINRIEGGEGPEGSFSLSIIKETSVDTLQRFREGGDKISYLNLWTAGFMKVYGRVMAHIQR